MTVHNIKNLAHFREIIQSHELVIIDAWATWCGPCRIISPVFEKLAELPDNAKIFFATLDVDSSPDTSQELGIRAMPTFVAFKNGEKTDEFVGADPAKLEQLVAQLAA